MVICGTRNTCLNSCIRGILLERFEQESDLCMANGIIPEIDNGWILRS